MQKLSLSFLAFGNGERGREGEREGEEGNTAITNWQRNSGKKEGRIANRMRDDDENGQLCRMEGTVMRCHAQNG